MLAMAARPLEAAVVTVEPGHALSKLFDSLVPLRPSHIDPQSAKSDLSPRGLVHMDSLYGISADSAGFSVRKLGVSYVDSEITAAERVRSQFCQQQAIDFAF